MVLLFLTCTLKQLYDFNANCIAFKNLPASKERSSYPTTLSSISIGGADGSRSPSSPEKKKIKLSYDLEWKSNRQAFIIEPMTA